jgi:branched-chain amino acid aminotransferase
MMRYAYFKNHVVPKEEAHISIASHSLQYGTMCFGGMRGYVHQKEVRMIRLRDHYDRLMNASKSLGFNFFVPNDNFIEIIGQLIKANAPEADFYVRPFIYSSDEVIGPCMDERNYDLAMYFLPLHQYFKKADGLRLMICSRKKFSDATMPTKAKASGCYLNSALATSEARRCGYDEALLMDDYGNIVEASVANLFVVYRGKVLTPPLGSGPLEGITMRTVIDLFKDEGIDVEYTMIDRSMLYCADEVFLTGSAAQITYVESVDSRIIGPYATPRMGPVCERAQKLFSDLITMNHKRSHEYMSVFKNSGEKYLYKLALS